MVKKQERKGSIGIAQLTGGANNNRTKGKYVRVDNTSHNLKMRPQRQEITLPQYLDAIGNMLKCDNAFIVCQFVHHYYFILFY